MKLKKAADAQRFILERCFLYELTDHILEQKSVLEKAIAHQKGADTDDYRIELEIKYTIWEGLYGYMAQQTIDLQLPPYVFRGYYDRLLKQLHVETALSVALKLKKLIEAVVNYVMTHNNAAQASAKGGRKQRQMPQKQVWAELANYIALKIKGLNLLVDLKNNRLKS